MKKFGLSKIHFPTALGLLILLVAIGVGVMLVRNRTGVDTEAEGSLTPRQVRITNVADTSFSVSWITDQVASGQIRYGTEANSLTKTAADERDQLSGDTGSYEVHQVTLKNLTATTAYYFKLESGGKQFDNNGKPFEVATGPTLGDPPAADPIYGTVLTSSGTAAEGVLVYINVANAGPLSALAKANGNWALNLSTARTADLGSYLAYDTQATIVNLLAQGGKLGTATAVTTAANDSPVPDITLGQSYDFRADAAKTQDQTAEPLTGFELSPIATGSAAATASGEVTLENPSFDGEVLNATQPAFIGTGPPGTVLTLLVESENTYTGSATVDASGEWEFSPPAGLTPGGHTVTISYIDDNGDERTLTRNFVIAAAGDSDEPAITATPSGQTASPSPAARTGLPATDSGVPEPGTGEITLLMLIMGLGLLAGGAVVKRINSL